MKVTIYNQTTGEIRLWGDVPEEFIADQLGGDAYVEGEFTFDTHYWNGTVMVAKPAKPAKPHLVSWDVANKVWVVDLTNAWVEVYGGIALRLRQSLDHVVPDTPDTPAQVAQWVAYRQAVRAVRNQPDPLNITWPTPPAS